MEQAKRISQLLRWPLFKALLVGLFLGGWCAYTHAQSEEIVHYSLQVPFVEEFYFDENSTTLNSRKNLDFLIEYSKGEVATLYVSKIVHDYSPDEDITSDEYAVVHTIIAIEPLPKADVEALNKKIMQVFPDKKAKLYAINRELDTFSLSDREYMLFRLDLWNNDGRELVFPIHYSNADAEPQKLEDRKIAFSQEFVDLMDCLYTICSRSIEGKYPHAILRNAKEWKEQRDRARRETNR